jgi:hypothetical protein
MESQRKKNKIIIRQINEIIGEQSIELGRDTYGVRKKNWQMTIGQGKHFTT